MNKYFYEFLGTFALVFADTGAIVINDVSGGVITHLGVALVFGMVVMAMIYAIGDVFGAVYWRHSGNLVLSYRTKRRLLP